MLAYLFAYVLLLIGPPMVEAKSFTKSGDYEKSVQLLLKHNPDRADGNEYHFLMSVNYFALNDKKNCQKHIDKLLDTFEPLEVRHETVARIMTEELKTWKTGDLADVGRDMRISGDRLKNGKGGQNTQAVQKEIINKLDKLIKEEEDRRNAKQGKGEGQGDDKKGDMPIPGRPKNGRPLEDSKPPSGTDGDGHVDEKKLRRYSDVWGTLPPAERAKVISNIDRDFPAKFRPMIDDYNRAINKINPKK